MGVVRSSLYSLAKAGCFPLVCLIAGCLASREPVLQSDPTQAGIVPSAYYKQCPYSLQFSDPYCANSDLFYLKDELDGSYTLHHPKNGPTRIIASRLDATTWVIQSKDPMRANAPASYLYSFLIKNDSNGFTVWTPLCYLNTNVTQSWGKQAGVDLPMDNTVCAFEIMKKTDLLNLLAALRREAIAKEGENYMMGGTAKRYKPLPDATGAMLWQGGRP